MFSADGGPLGGIAEHQISILTQDLYEDEYRNCAAKVSDIQYQGILSGRCICLCWNELLVKIAMVI